MQNIVGPDYYQAVDEDARCVDLVWLYLADRDDFLRFDDRAASRSRHQWVEVPLGEAEDQVAELVSPPGSGESVVSRNRFFQDVGPAVEDAVLLALRQLCTDRCGRVERGD